MFSCFRIPIPLLLSLTLTTHASGGEWLKSFKSQKGWSTASKVVANGNKLTTQPDGKPSFFTNATMPGKAGYLQTVAKYGDCTVETEFMIPKGSNSGIYFMGRYEIQILDSHGKEKVGHGDMGGVYQRWDNKRKPPGFEGTAPKVNAANPAGEWQKMTIKFRAPRLQKDGTLIEKPRFLSVHLNGKLVQENVILNGHTRAAQRTGWAARDHLFIQGDHGPIAFRKFKVTPEDFPAQTKDSTPSKRPNFVVIMVDDMGYSDIGCFGGEVKTPNLDLLAKGGMRFTQFYNTAKCHTTRAELLTGNYAYSIGDQNMEHGATFAEVLRAAGYRTLISGKWHQQSLPTTRGFDRYFGLADGCCNFFNPGLKAREGEGPPGRKGKNRVRRWAIEDKTIMGYTNPDKKFYTTDAFTDYALERLDEYQDEDKPFLLYLPYTAPHYPLHAWPEDIAKYRGKYKVGWDEIRKQRFARMKEMGIIGEKHQLTPRDARAWDELSEKEKDAEDLKMAVYAAMIDRVDQNLGRLFAKLKELEKWDNTLILFLSDNGACREQPNTTPNIPPGPVESYRTISVGWANASNTPYRKYKSTDFEGGIRTPFIAHWPAVIKPGLTGQVGHLIDINATFRDITGAGYPKEINGRKTKPPVGKSLLPILQGKTREPHSEIYWRFGKANAIRQGDLKAIRVGKSWELYDLSKDPTEMNDLSKKESGKAKELGAMWEKWKKETANRPN